MYREKTGLCHSGRFDRMKSIGVSLVVLTLILCAALPATAVDGEFIGHKTPSYVASAKNLGTVDPSKTIEVSLWLNLHNRGEMDALARDLYDRTFRPPSSLPSPPPPHTTSVSPLARVTHA